MYLTSNPSTFTASGIAPMITAPQQGVTLLNTTVTSAVNTQATATLTGAGGQRVTIRGIYVKATGAAATSTIIVQDGATTVLDLGTITIPLAGATVQFNSNPLVAGTTGNSLTVTVGAGGALSVTTTSIIADRQ